MSFLAAIIWGMPKSEKPKEDLTSTSLVTTTTTLTFTSTHPTTPIFIDSSCPDIPIDPNRTGCCSEEVDCLMDACVKCANDNYKRCKDISTIANCDAVKTSEKIKCMYCNK